MATKVEESPQKRVIKYAVIGAIALFVFILAISSVVTIPAGILIGIIVRFIIG